MKYALFLGCNIPARVEQYEASARAILRQIDVRLTDIREFNCCGYPLRNSDQRSFLFSSAVNLALAEKAGLDIMVLCKCCFGSLKEAEHILKEEGNLQEEVNRLLAQRDLNYAGKPKIKHFLSVLYHDVGLDTLKSKITRQYKDFKIVTHYGCHALRPSKITQFDDPVAPTLFDKLVEVTGAKSVDWTSKLECCGAPVLGVNDDLSMSLTKRKIADGKKVGADYLCSACPYCHLQFDTIQKVIISQNGNDSLAPVLYPQLLGLSMGIDEKTLGIGMNQLDISGVTSFLIQE
ncbi:MAG: CoB--CoM heterodisulfide reductase iron-sulfur subunit B family protein [Deltaproteobacteria bacterium]|jgi:heterodisulfide reductase subunit B|nr:CoB--CoM heterodisulfide reductase iron-sulfur subunit B family protein [Deltaproteobacteria bacterium]MBW2173401.1 CoB--CoM heterodisulfide reductase iron-sulfur subunit B family protein [Deltaproteobacteria bacterium]MBW2238977.1 CoB--CoM heterodisulfide reductase iron-sulfur subunit B family protein [Deltaproteobacteria bacterium]MBW2571384.1 CoB--CoM heterodisulfide reductase iron-sulfur subunit B family protein [Deltaproteobacteria bacterium]MBW2668452.1 CoB--CoM heterodisulfide reducta